MTKRSSFTIFKAVVNALFLREVQTRFGTKKLGYFWALFDAMLMVLVFGGLKSMVAQGAMPGVDFPVFLATGFLAFFLFKNIVSRSMNAFEANAALFNYAQVRPIDTLVARVLLELLVSTMATLVFVLIGLYFEYDMQVQDFNMVILSVSWFTLFAFGIGLLSAVLGSFYETFQKVVKVLMTPLFFISALMYTVDSLPPLLRELILYNPLVHFIEMLHGNYFHALNTTYVDYGYMFYWTFIPLFAGLFLYIRTEKKIIAS